MMIHEITPAAGRYKKRKRIGRGPGSGTGKTAGRGHKGAGSRSGFAMRPDYEGGQNPFYKRLPKRGFNNANFTKIFTVVNVRALNARFDDGAEVNPDMLMKVGLIHDTRQPVKILGDGELTKKLTVTAAKFTKSAQEKITAAGGSVQVAG